jgi:PAS domain S-box-containing protein
MPDSLPSPASGDSAPPRSAATVIIVTADEALAGHIERSLAHSDLTCLTTRSGPAALKQLSHGALKLMLVDLALPGLSSQELLEWRRQAGRPVPFIALISPGEERLGFELMRGGALDCLVKDAQLLELLRSAVERALQRLEQQRQAAAAQQALRQSETRHRARFELASVGMMEGDPQTGRFLRVNEKFCQLTGYSAQELQAKCVSEITHPEERDADWQAYQRAVRGETRDYRSEKRYLRKDGSAVWVRVNVFMIRDEQGHAVHSVGVAEDITERKRAEEALRESEERYRSISESGFISIAFFTTDGRITEANDAWLRLMGVSRQELAAGLVRWDQLTAPEWLARTRQAVAEVEATGRALPYEKEYIRRDGSRFWGLVGGAKLEGRPEGVAFVLDITERKQAEEALREREAQLAFAQRVGRVGVWGRDLVTRTSFVTEEWCEIVGVKEPASVRSLPEFLALVHPDDRPRVEAANRRTIQTGSDMDLELRILHPERGERWLLARARRLASANGKGQRLLGVIIDITERKRAEEQLAAHQAQLEEAQALARLGSWHWDIRAGTLVWSNELYRIFGRKPEEFVPTHEAFLELVHSEDRAPIEAAVEGALSAQRPYDSEVRIVRPDHSLRILHTRGRVIFDENGKPLRMFGTAQDITERKRVEEQLRASEERLRFAAQAAGFGCYELDLVSGQAYRSPEYKALFELRPNDEFQLDADHLPIYVHPDDRALVREATLESLDPQGSGTQDVEYRILLPDGTMRWLLVRGHTFFEGEGEARRPVRAIGIALDITERKQLEQEILEISGREQRRIGHDLHDDLCQRLGGLQLLSGVLEKELAAEGYPQAPQAGRISSQVHEALERARLLARGLAPVAVEEGGLTTALEELADNAAQLFHIRCEFRAELPVGVTDAGAATHLYRIAQEAITNAVKHGRAKRVLIDLTDAGDSFELKVIDDGRGFGRTKAPMAGMGLRIMKYRAAMLGATLGVHSTAGQGTTVTCAFGKGLCSAVQRYTLDKAAATRRAR